MDEEPELFIRKEVCNGQHSPLQNQSSHEVTWDDTLLIKAYDKAIHKAKKQIMKKLQNEMNLENEDIKDICSESSSGAQSIDKKKKKKKKKGKSIAVNDTWKVGSACRAIYSEDGEEYEAEIIDMLTNSMCLICYVGYGNQESVMLKDLMPSLGKHAVEMQILEAERDKTVETESGETDEESFRKHSKMISPKRIIFRNDYTPQTKSGCPQQSSYRTPMMQKSPPFPPPPPPPFSKNSSHEIPCPMSGSEDLNPLLLSWYMCGYYTGYYQRDLMEQKKSCDQ